MWRQHCKKGLNPPRIKPKACHCLLSVFKSRFLDYRVLFPYFRSGTQTVCTVHTMYRLNSMDHSGWAGIDTRLYPEL